MNKETYIRKRTKTSVAPDTELIQLSDIRFAWSSQSGTALKIKSFAVDEKMARETNGLYEPVSVTGQIYIPVNEVRSLFMTKLSR